MKDVVFENILRIAKDKFNLVRKKDVAEKIGANSQKMTNWKNRGVPSDSYKSIAESLGVTINTLIDKPLDFGWMDREHGNPSRIEEPAPIYGNNVIAWDSFDELSDDYIQVPRYDVHVSAGNGSTLHWDEIEKDKPNAFRREFFIAKGVSPKNIKSLYAKGDSMEERIFDGDSLTVDVSKTNIIDNKYYVIRIEDEIFVKQLRKRPAGGLEIISKNPNYPPMILSAEETQHVQIIGRVIHISSDGGDL